MFLSMTGFSSKTAYVNFDKNLKILVTVEIKSVNSRFFEVVCKLPNSLSFLELKINKILKDKLIRGRVYFSLKVEDEVAVLEDIVPSFSLLEKYLKAFNQIKSKFKLTGDVSIHDLLVLPGVFVNQRVEVNKTTEHDMLNLVEDCLNLLVKNREREGINLKKDLEKSFTKSAKRIEEIKSFFNKHILKIKEAIKNSLALQQQGKDDAKLKLDELYSTLNKVDIHEEVVRFKSHLDNVKKVLKDKNMEKGKRIDFILQELMREANTILAKSSDCNISSAAVDIKVELEKAREQIQNII